MGWDAVQTKTSSSIPTPSSGPAQGRQQTALPERDVKAAPPEGFRQRIAHGFQQAGRRLASVVTGLPGRMRLDTARRSTRSHLSTLLDRLDLGDLDSPKLGLELARLAHEKRQWMQKDPEAGRQFGEMVRTLVEQRWPARHILHIEKAISLMLAPGRGHLPEAGLREELAGLVTARADEYRAGQGLKASHKNAIAKMGFETARSIAGDIFWKGALLCAAVKAFDKATSACEYQDGATEADLQAARNALEDAGNQLLEALEAKHPKQAERALAGRYLSSGNQRAIFIRPRNQAQADLHSQFIAGYRVGTPPNKAAVVAKSEQAKALWTRVAQDEPQRLRGAQRTAETQYFRELRKERRYIENVVKLGASADDADTEALRAALDRLPTSVTGAGRSADEEPVDYAKALDTLHEVIAAADRKVAPLVEDTIEQIKQLEKVSNVPERAQKAQQLVANTNEAVLRKLPLREQLALLQLVRGDIQRQPPAGSDSKQFPVAQSKLYGAMALDPQLVRHDKQVRRQVMAELRQDKKMLQDARDLWQIYTPDQKRQVILKVAQAHSRALGCEPPRAVVFTTDPSVTGYQWRPHDRAIVVGTANRRHMDFEDTMEGVFHENSHNWQFQLVDQLKQLPRAAQQRHPLHGQALMFAANLSFYHDGRTDYVGYRSQPVEAHAYRAGMKLGAEFMRMLAS